MIINKLLKPVNIAFNKAQFTRKFGTAELEELMKIIHDANWFKREVETLRNKVQLQSDTIHSNQVQLLNTTLSDIFPSSNTPLDKVIPEGTAIEPNYHLLYHPSHLPETELSKDGYDPDFAPPNPYIDRVWAKGKLEFNPQNLIKVGQKVDLKTKTHQITQSSSSSKGPIFSVELLKEYTNSSGSCLNEYRTLSYFLNTNEVGAYGVKFDQNTKIIKARDRSYDRMVEVNPNSLLLFRYSALTFNAHKIHYDYNYATKEEGYRDLLVHGPLTTTLTLKLITKYLQETHSTWQTLKSLDYKLIQPLYNNEQFNIYLKQTGEDSLDVWINNCRGELAFKGFAKF